MPRCQRYGASFGIIFAASSKVAADCTKRPSANSSTARSSTAFGPCAKRSAHVSALTQIESRKRVIVPNIEDTVSDRRIGAHRGRKHLRGGDLLEGFRRGRGQYQIARLAHDQQPIAGERHAARPEPFCAPEDFSALQIDRAKHGAELLT